MPRAIRLLILALPVFLTGCPGDVKPTIPVTPQIVEVPVTKYVAVPEDLTQPCPIETPQKRTVAEAVRVAAARKASLVSCNAQLDAIRNLGK